MTQLIQKLGESPLGLATGGVKQPPTELALATPATGEELKASVRFLSLLIDTHDVI